MLKVLVTGATGFIGSQLVSDLAASGPKVTALTRKTSNVRYLERLGIEIHYGDVTNLRSLDTLKGLVNPRVYDSEAKRDIDFRPLPLGQGLEMAFVQVEGNR